MEIHQSFNYSCTLARDYISTESPGQGKRSVNNFPRHKTLSSGVALISQPKAFSFPMKLFCTIVLFTNFIVQWKTRSLVARRISGLSPFLAKSKHLPQGQNYREPKIQETNISSYTTSSKSQMSQRCMAFSVWPVGSLDCRSSWRLCPQDLFPMSSSMHTTDTSLVTQTGASIFCPFEANTSYRLLWHLLPLWSSPFCTWHTVMHRCSTTSCICTTTVSAGTKQAFPLITLLAALPPLELSIHHQPWLNGTRKLVQKLWDFPHKQLWLPTWFVPQELHTILWILPGVRPPTVTTKRKSSDFSFHVYIYLSTLLFVYD